MVVHFIDSNIGAPVYVNPEYVQTVRPDPVDPDHVSIVKLRDGESMRLQGEHQVVAKKLALAA